MSKSFSDKVLAALESGEWMNWSQLCLATDLTLFWVRESLNSLVEEGMVEVSGDAVFKFRLSNAQVSQALEDAGIDMTPAVARLRSMVADARTNKYFNDRHDARVAAGNQSLIK